MATSTTNIIKITEPFQQGDTFKLRFKYKEDDVASDLPIGQGLVAALYDRKWNLLQSAKTSDGTLAYEGDHVYSMVVTHESSMKMISVVYLEITIATEDLSLVDHAKQIVEMTFDTRKNNNLLGGA